MNHFDIIIIGAGAAGLFCAGEIDSSKSVLVLEHNKKPGLKIQVSGGGRCNFTNKIVNPGDFSSENSHFMKSALRQYSSTDFINEVIDSGIDHYEKKLGQMFCRNSSKDIINFLIEKCQKRNTKFKYEVKIKKVIKKETFIIKAENEDFYCDQLIIASGGLSFPGLGASDLGYRIAKKFDLEVTELSPSLVPITFEGVSELSGIALPVKVKIGKKEICDDILFTHRGFSGPVILKATLYDYMKGFQINFLPNEDLHDLFMSLKNKKPQINWRKTLKDYLPIKFISFWLGSLISEEKKSFQDLSKKDIHLIVEKIQNWKCLPTGNEGYKKAEVTKGGIKTSEISSKTLEAKKVAGLFFIGEVVDVTGLLGGYNFQWAWSSAYAAAQKVNE